METSQLQLTPEQRSAVLSQPGVPVYIADDATRRVYMLVEKGLYPELEEDYILAGLEVAREQIARGETSNASIDEVIAKAERLRSS
jgi:hypothetical protein